MAAFTASDCTINGGQAQVGFGQLLEGFTALLIHLARDAGIETAEGTTQVAVEAQQLAAVITGLVIETARLREIAAGGSRVTAGQQGAHGLQVEGAGGRLQGPLRFLLGPGRGPQAGRQGGRQGQRTSQDQ